MKVIHIVGGDLSRGAHLGALWLHQGLREIGVNSSLITPATVTSEDPSIHSLSHSKVKLGEFKLRRHLAKVVLLPYRHKQRVSFSSGFFGGRISNHPLVREADIVHLHWVAKGPISLNDMSRLQQPTVLTMRDMWPFTGGCHYAIDCERYMQECGQCPQLGSKSKFDLSSLVMREKMRCLPKNLTCVGISEWISDCAKKSSILRDKRIETISNCVDTELFTPYSQDLAREKLKLPHDRKIILIGAESVTSYYKGFGLFLDAAAKLGVYNPLILIFGNIASEHISNIPLETRSLGYLSDSESLQIAYSAADVFVAPSRQEAFGKTLVESMACATPVVCFDATGPKDIVEHQHTGYKAKPFETSDLANGILWVLNNTNKFNLRQNSRTRAVKLFSQKVVAKKYNELYNQLYQKSTFSTI